MLKLVAEKGDGTKVLMLGISAENVQRLVSGMPVMVKGSEVGLPEIEVAIFYGDTEEAMVEDLRKVGFVK